MSGGPPTSQPSSTPGDGPLAEVTHYLHSEIPLTRAMGVAVTAWDGATVTVRAPLALNQNHADTAFGGSIASLGIVAGYTSLYLLLRDRNISTRILIQKSAVEYHRPVDDDLVCTATFPGGAVLEEFLETMRRKRRARVTVESLVICRKMLAATHSGVFVAMLY